MRLTQLWRLDGLSVLQWSGVMRFGAVLATSVLLPWLGLSGNNLAIVESWLFVQSMLSFFWINAINTAIFRIPEHDRQRLSTIARLSRLAWSLSIFMTVPACLLLFTLLPESAIQLRVFFLFALSMSFQAGSALLDSMLYQKAKLSKLLLLGSAFNISFITGSALIAYSGIDLIFLLAFWTLISALRSLLFYLEKPQEQDSNSNRNYLKIIYELLPLILLSALGGASEYICGMAVRYGLGSDEFVIFRYGSREFPFIMIMAGAISNAFSGKIAGNSAEGLAGLRSRSAAFMPIAFLLTAGLMIISPFLFRVLLPESLSQAWPVFCTILLLTIPRTLFPQTVVLGLKRDRWVLEALCAELIVLILILFILLPVAGILAAPIALCLAYLSDKIYLVYRLKSIEITFTQYTSAGLWFALSFTLLLIWGLVISFA